MPRVLQNLEYFSEHLTMILPFFTAMQMGFGTDELRVGT